MNPLSTNFKRNKKMNKTFCVNTCEGLLDNQHLVLCQILNPNSNITYMKILNGNILEKKEALHQTMENERVSSLNGKMKPCDPVHL